jgi:hypothetical protein
MNLEIFDFVIPRVIKHTYEDPKSINSSVVPAIIIIVVLLKHFQCTKREDLNINRECFY